jgi:hypothetical protein
MGELYSYCHAIIEEVLTMVVLRPLVDFWVNIQNKICRSVFLRVPLILLRKTGTYSEISTKNLGHLGKKEDTF